MIFYLAGQYNRREELCGYRADLEARGHSVPARWLLGEHQVHGVEAARLVQAGGPVPVEEARPFAEDDIEDIEACDVFVAFTAPPPQSGRGGRHVETGYAYALHRDRQFWDGEAGDLTTPLVIVGPAENIFHSLPEFQRFPTWAAFLVDLDAKHTPAQFCDCINPATGRRHREIPGDPPYHCAAAPAPRQWEYPTCTSHPTAERTHWNGTAWVEPPDGEAMEPRPTWTCEQIDARWDAKDGTTPVIRHAFNRAVEASVARTQAISGQRGETYQDTWSEEIGRAHV